jgi:endonuclease/exonuclease/phosphatase family metal-dependent hydrolase
MPEPDQALELRVLHWNVHSWRDDKNAPNRDRVADLVAATDPDVVSLVEVDEAWNTSSTLDELAIRCGYASIFSPTLEFGQDEPAGGFGNAILTRLPILAVRQRQLMWPVPGYDGSEPSEPRTAVFVKLQVGAQGTWIVSTHLPRTDEHTRTHAVRRLMTMVHGLNQPWLLVGDFNTPAAAWIQGHGRVRAHPDPPIATYPTKQPVEAIDYCVAPASQHVEAEVLTVQGSDHLALLVRSWHPPGQPSP